MAKARCCRPIGSVQVEAVWVGEYCRIPVRAGERDRHEVAVPDSCRAETDVRCGEPVDDRGRGLEPERFLDRCLGQAAVSQHLRQPPPYR